jgi:hypothetical protein
MPPAQAAPFRAAFFGQATLPARASSFHGTAALAVLPRSGACAARRSALVTRAKVLHAGASTAGYGALGLPMEATCCEMSAACGVVGDGPALGPAEGMWP